MNKEYCVYALYKDRNIIYIGITKSIKTRLRQHKLTKDFDYIKTIVKDLTSREAIIIESAMITFLSEYLKNPLSNKAGNREYLIDLVSQKREDGVNV